MALYKNREVTVLGSTPMATTPTTINIQHRDGTNEHVALSHVSFTKEESDALKKAHPSQYENINIVDDSDIKAVRLGITPPSDPVLKEQAKAKAQHQKQLEAVKTQEVK